MLVTVVEPFKTGCMFARTAPVVHRRLLPSNVTYQPVWIYRETQACFQYSTEAPASREALECPWARAGPYLIGIGDCAVRQSAEFGTGDNRPFRVVDGI